MILVMSLHFIILRYSIDTVSAGCRDNQNRCHSGYDLPLALLFLPAGSVAALRVVLTVFRISSVFIVGLTLRSSRIILRFCALLHGEPLPDVFPDDALRMQQLPPALHAERSLPLQ